MSQGIGSISGIAAVISLVAFMFDITLLSIDNIQTRSAGQTSTLDNAILTLACWVLRFSGSFFMVGRSGASRLMQRISKGISAQMMISAGDPDLLFLDMTSREIEPPRTSDVVHNPLPQTTTLITGNYAPITTSFHIPDETDYPTMSPTSSPPPDTSAQNLSTLYPFQSSPIAPPLCSEGASIPTLTISPQTLIPDDEDHGDRHCGSYCSPKSSYSPTIRIAVVTENFLPKIDGVTRVLAMVLQHLQRKKHRAIVLAPEGAPSCYAGMKVFGVPGVPLPVYPEIKVLWPQSRFKAILSRWRPDVIHVADPMILGAATILWAQQLGIPVVSSYHTNISIYCTYFRGCSLLAEPIWTYRRFLHSLCSVTLCPSPSTAQQLRQRGFTNVKLWPRGVDGTLFNPNRRSDEWRRHITTDPNARIILYVGRIAHEKNLSVLLSAFNAIESQDPHVHLVMVGDGPARLELEQLLRGKRAVFTGYLHGEALSTAYASADIFAFPSITETFGQVVLEAMASGLPVLAFDADGVRDQVQQDETGVIVPKGDNAAFTEGLRTLLGQPERQARMGICARSAAELCTWDGVMDDVLRMYEKVIRGSKRKYPCIFL